MLRRISVPILPSPHKVASMSALACSHQLIARARGIRCDLRTAELPCFPGLSVLDKVLFCADAVAMRLCEL